MTEVRKPAKRGRRLGAAATSVGGHLFVLAAFLFGAAPALRPAPVEPVVVDLVEPVTIFPPSPEPAPAPPAPEKPAKPTPVKAAAAAPKKAAPKPAQPKSMARATRVRPDAETLPAAPGEGVTLAAAGPAFGVSDSELAGAMAAGSGTGGGGCDMAGRVQAALRKDPLARAAIAQAHGLTAGRPIRVWNGDWVQSPTEDGKGLSAVREAIMWEVAFAPEACKHKPERGLITLSMNDSTRIVVGLNQWRWTDLLGRR